MIYLIYEILTQSSQIGFLQGSSVHFTQQILLLAQMSFNEAQIWQTTIREIVINYHNSQQFYEFS